MASRKGTIKEPEDAVKVLENKFNEQMKAFQARLDSAQPSTQLEQLTADFNAFKNRMMAALDTIKAQVSSLTEITDDLDNRSRRKFLLFRGVKESEENSLTLIRDIVTSNLKLSIEESDIRSCFRLGSVEADKTRPILVRFSNPDIRADIWRAKKDLKGNVISIAEFLTTRRREIFKEARSIFGKHCSWTQDGNVFVKISNGKKVKLTSLQQLRDLAADKTQKPSRRDRSRARAARQDKKPS